MTTNRINEVFQNKKNVLSVYYTAGFPELNNTLAIAQNLEVAGADIIEIGMPFSDPVADGPTIQESNKKALENGMSIQLLFEQLKEVRQSVSIPIILMGYINPVLQFGIDAFCEKCEEVGVDGLILPDLPMAEYLALYKDKFDDHGIKNVFLITPQTSENRVREIDQNTDGFIYMVSSASTTGARGSFSEEQISYFERIKKMDLKNPTLIGFGISNNDTYEQACTYSSGAIIGSAFINCIDSSGIEKEIINQFVKDIKG
ncbi:tryptophan synthase subunit alpha [Fulvivirga maritima]|nr:tryptophan synthase subunit alpha [Fulvivirga maritima]UII26674.1 tryptophan synthase subunit alpha [Fulvivirga maritima]